MIEGHIHSILVSRLPCVISHHPEHTCWGPIQEIVIQEGFGQTLPMCNDARLYFHIIGEEIFERRWEITLEAEVAYLQRFYKGG